VTESARNLAARPATEMLKKLAPLSSAGRTVRDAFLTSSKPRVEFARPMEQVRRHGEWGVQVLRALATSKLSLR
jgi:hypothetical protein